MITIPVFMLPKKVCFTPSIHLRFMDKDFAFLPVPGMM